MQADMCRFCFGWRQIGIESTLTWPIDRKKMNGLHLIADLNRCRCPQQFLIDAADLELFCVSACTQNGLTVVGRFFHQFADAAGHPAGVTGAVVLAESHLTLHTWPEIKGVSLDVYVCNFSADNSQVARRLFARLIEVFQPETRTVNELERGRPGSGAASSDLA